MNQLLTWLHLSDLHFDSPNSGWDAEHVLETLEADLKLMQGLHGVRPDLIFFTGDAANGQRRDAPGHRMSDQFAGAHGFLSRVREAFTPFVPQENLFLVPGNHDVNRGEVSPEQTEWLDGDRSADEVLGLIKDTPKQWRRYMERLDDYLLFLKEHGYEHLLQDGGRLVYAVTREVQGVAVGVAGMNSAWSCGRNGEKGRLWMGARWQVTAARTALRQAQLKIALVHHPSNWLVEQEDPDMGRRVETNFHFCLHGHEHQEWVSQSEEHVRVAAGACYDRSDKENGYNFVQLNPSTGEATVWLRRYHPRGERWGQEVIPGKTDSEGRWFLKGLPRLLPAASPSGSSRSAKPASSASGSSDDSEGQPAGAVFPTGAASTSVLAPWAAEQKPQHGRGALAVRQPVAQEEQHEVLRLLAALAKGPPEARRELEQFRALYAALPAGDIEFEVLVPTLPPQSVQTPSLQELNSERQVAEHFVVFPRLRARLEEWLGAPRDWLFLGLPFCGKTSLLSFLALEAARGGEARAPLSVVRLRPREDLDEEKVPVAASRLLEQLESESLLGTRTILVLDNVHRPSHFALARHLQSQSPRRWRLWGAARVAEFNSLVSTCSGPWEAESCVREACDLTDKEEADHMIEAFFRPLLASRGQEKWAEDVREALRERGQVPVRFLIAVWQQIFEDRADVSEGYRPWIAAAPTQVEDIVRSLWPQTAAGVEALAVADLLRDPPREVLLSVLLFANRTEQRREELAAETLSQLRDSLALLPDAEDERRVTMYDPVREHVRHPANQSASLHRRAWAGVAEHLAQALAQAPPPAPDAMLCGYWLDLIDAASTAEQLDLRLDCARMAVCVAPDELALEARFSLANVLLDMGATREEEAVAALEEAVRLAQERKASGEQPRLAGALSQFLLGMALIKVRDSTQAKDAHGEPRSHATSSDLPRVCALLEAARDDFAAVGMEAPFLAGLDTLVGTLMLNQVLDKPGRSVLGSTDAEDAVGEQERALIERAKSRLVSAYEVFKSGASEMDVLNEMLPPSLKGDTAGAASDENAEAPLREKRRDSTRADISAALASCAVWGSAEPDWTEVAACYRHATGLLRRLGDRPKLAHLLWHLSHALHQGPSPDWEQSDLASREAIEVHRALWREAQQKWKAGAPQEESGVARVDGDATRLQEVAWRFELALKQRAWLCQAKPQLNRDDAVECLEEALQVFSQCDQLLTDVIVSPEAAAENEAEDGWQNEHAEAFLLLADCLFARAQERDAAAVERAQAAGADLIQKSEYDAVTSDLSRALGAATEGAQVLRSLWVANSHFTLLLRSALEQVAGLHQSQDAPDWAATASIVREALDLAPEDGVYERADLLYTLAKCLWQQPHADVPSAAKAARQAVEHFMRWREENEFAPLPAAAPQVLEATADPAAEQVPQADEREEEEEVVVEAQWWEDVTQALQLLAEILGARSPDLEAAEEEASARTLLASLLATPPEGFELFNNTRESVRQQEAQNLYRLCTALVQKEEPAWAQALDASRGAEEICRELGDVQGVRACLVHQVELMPIAHPSDFAGYKALLHRALAQVSALHDAPERITLLNRLAIVMVQSDEADWPGAIATLRQALDECLNPQDEVPRAVLLWHLAYLLESQPTPDLEGALATLQLLPDSTSFQSKAIEIVRLLDRMGRTDEGDTYAARLRDFYNTSPVELLVDKRCRAQLALREDDLDQVLRLSHQALREEVERMNNRKASDAAPEDTEVDEEEDLEDRTVELARLQMLASIAHWARDDHDKSRRSMEAAGDLWILGRLERAWIRNIADLYFNRAPDKLGGYLAALNEIPASRRECDDSADPVSAASSTCRTSPSVSQP